MPNKFGSLESSLTIGAFAHAAGVNVETTRSLSP